MTTICTSETLKMRNSTTVQANMIPILFNMTPSYKAKEDIRKFSKLEKEKLMFKSISRNLLSPFNLYKLETPMWLIFILKKCDTEIAEGYKCTS
jgi:hypothetical protein